MTPLWNLETLKHLHESQLIAIIVGHKATTDCHKPKQEKKWCSFCKSSSYTDKSCSIGNKGWSILLIFGLWPPIFIM